MCAMYALARRVRCGGVRMLGGVMFVRCVQGRQVWLIAVLGGQGGELSALPSLHPF